MTTTTDFLDDAAASLGPRGLTRDADLIQPWLTDWRGRFTGSACAMASPASTEELSRLVRLCASHGVPIVPQGGNSGMSGGATPDDSGKALLLSLRRMNTIHEIDVEARRVTCGAGVVLQTLHEAVEDKGLRFPLTLGGKGSATVGGLISTNAGGSQVLRHGSMRALVLGLEAVLADGQVFSMLTPLKKDNRGFDLKQLLIGSEGTMGIVTAATLKLVPAVADRVVIWAGLPSLGAARTLLLHCEDMAGDALEGFEVMPQACLDAVLRHLPDARAPLAGRHAWHVLIEVVADRTSAATLRERCEAMMAEAFDKDLLEDATMSASEAQAEAFWLLRESVAPAERERGPAVQHDISVPVEKMPAFVEATGPMIEAEWPGTEAVAFGHLGDGNVHYHVIAPHVADGLAWQKTDGKAISRRMHDLVTEWGGSISAEHGIGQLKRDELARLGDPVALSMLRAVKHALDPQGLLNPGKLI
ncbi:FAD-binding oxidoreductase [Novosphingobium mangrovi (ex Huang et al. 2023)]|uniref:FAD-binding oxidoreductase n=1 Tax=Novosphingobium mangrovi (ex Huang et al. 2023) TaxID=2976432 RepID=A0ABT2I760_9SPHN|nr:FAD-binding oxidoreductase [Novosphingobium mangrovi (ex Huang et al. 2023)]MCT2400653.1 FAD-binding oxidoreductase [Novosphingobium mangrovi (ex Huang et al. 2023)]